MRIAQRALQLRRVAQGFHKLKGHDGGLALRLLRRHAINKICAPIDEWPPRYVPKQTVGPLASQKPSQSGSGSRKLSTDEGRIAAVHPEVMDHPNPQQRKRRNHLLQRRWITALR